MLRLTLAFQPARLNGYIFSGIFFIIALIFVFLNVLNADEQQPHAPLSTYKLCNLNTCFEITPTTLEVRAEIQQPISKLTKKEIVSNSQYPAEVSNIIFTPTSLSFIRRNSVVYFIAEKKYLKISFKVEGEDNYGVIFPRLSPSDFFILPIQSGKCFSVKSAIWQKYLLNKKRIVATEALTMQFFAGQFQRFTALYVIDGNIYNNELHFINKQNMLTLDFSHKKTHKKNTEAVNYRLYVFPNEDNINIIANEYKQYQLEKKTFVTLKEKQAVSSDVTKLYGAPFIYLWGDEVVGADNVKWPAFLGYLKRQLLVSGDNPTKYFNAITENSLRKLANKSYLSDYEKSNFEETIKKLVLNNNLYNEKAFNGVRLNLTAKSLLVKGGTKLSPEDIITLNKNLIQSSYADFIAAPTQWGNGVSTFMVKELQAIGLNRAWLGLNNRWDGILHSNVVQEAVKAGYLIAPYDTYYTIFKNGDTNSQDPLPAEYFNNKTIKDINGKYITGFEGKGRTLNSSLILPLVNYRLNSTLKEYNAPFNSWFYDSDGAGELYDDYSIDHPMNKKKDHQNILERMKIASSKFHLVIGTEDGKDYIASGVAYAHGNISSAIIDQDMRNNTTSKYYMGSYYAPLGTPPRYTKLSLLPSYVKSIFYDMQYSVPLYQLVYNDSIIISEHWEYGTFKFPEELQDNLIRPFLYSYPPILHLDRTYWIKHKNFFADYLPKVSKVIRLYQGQKMLKFNVLSSDRLVQKATFENGYQVIANFKDEPYNYKGLVLQTKGVIVKDAQGNTVFSYSSAQAKF
ncbi:glycoside hydrolase [Serratia fonticola]|uniref:glycoside hydrolase n=1 Tax=Serratia fonticola TaxID=47917 RepID=UPI00301D3D25